MERERKGEIFSSLIKADSCGEKAAPMKKLPRVCFAALHITVQETGVSTGEETRGKGAALLPVALNEEKRSVCSHDRSRSTGGQGGPE